jgi:hypothetical protein
MRALGGFCVFLLLDAGLVAQHSHGGYINPQPLVRGGFPNALYPGGTAATTPGLTRFNGNVVYPGGGGPFAGGQNLRRPGVPPATGGRILGTGAGAVVAVPYAYPVYVGGYGYGYGYGYPPSDDAAAAGAGYAAGYAPDASAYAPGAAPQQPNVIVIYAQPPQPGVAPPNGAPPPGAYPAPAAMEPPPEASVGVMDPSHYLIAFKDHTIYAAVAYWVEGDTLHYFTAQNTHNQVSLELVDRSLTERLTQESGLDMRLPPASSGK